MEIQQVYSAWFDIKPFTMTCFVNQTYIRGIESESTDLPTMNAIQPTYGAGLWDMFVAKFNGIGASEFITYFGGNKSERAWDVRVDNNNDILMVGRTYSDNFPTVNAVQSTHNGNVEACLVKLSSDAQTILTSTFFGGSSNDYSEGLAVDGDGHVVITGRTSSEDLDITSGAYQSTNAGGYDAFICHTTLDYISESPTDTHTTTSEPSNTDNLPMDSTLILIIVASSIGVVAIIGIMVMKKR